MDINTAHTEPSLYLVNLFHLVSILVHLLLICAMDINSTCDSQFALELGYELVERPSVSPITSSPASFVDISLGSTGATDDCADCDRERDATEPPHDVNTDTPPLDGCALDDYDDDEWNTVAPQPSEDSKREYLLAQIRQKDAIIESLLKQVSAFGRILFESE